MDDPSALPSADALEPTDVRLLSSFLESVGAGSALPLLRASGFSDQNLPEISQMNPLAIQQMLGLSHEQADELLSRVNHHLTNQFLEQETVEIRELVETAGFDYGVFTSVDVESQQEILNSLKRRRNNPQTAQGMQAAHSQHASSSELPTAANRVSVADMSAEGHEAGSVSRSQLDHAVCILAEFFPSMQAEAIADMLHSMGLKLDEAVDTILEDMSSSSSSKRKSSSNTSASRLDAVRQIGATRSGVEGADWKSVYSWISASTGQACSSSAASDASLDSLVAFMKVAMNVDDPAAGVEQSVRERYRQLLSTRGPEHELTVIAACNFAACLVDQKKHSAAIQILQSPMQWFSSKTGSSLDPSPFAGLSDDTARQYAHAQILYAECLIADHRTNGESASVLMLSIEAENHRMRHPPKTDFETSAAGSGASNMDSEISGLNVSGSAQGGGPQTFICDACDVVLPSTVPCYRCTSCLDFHICIPCHAKYEHCKECHAFEVVDTRTPVPSRPLCLADIHLRNALSLPSLAAAGGANLTKAKACIAECYLFQNRLSECESICRDIVQNNLSEVQRTHPVMLRTLMCLGSCLAVQFKWEESQTIFEQVLSHYDAQKGRNSVDSLSVLMQISEQLYRRGCPLSSMSVLEDCNARHVSVRGKADIASLRCACMLGHFYAVMCDDARSVTILNDAVLTACATHGQNSVIACQCKYHLGIALFIQKNVSAAFDCLAPLADTSMIPADNLVTRARLGVLSHKAKIAAFQCLANLGRLSEAIPSLQDLQALHDSMFGRQHKYYGQTLVVLARAQHLSGNARAARCLYDKAVPLLSRLMGPQHHHVIAANVAYASALIELQQFRVARPLLESAHSLQVQCLGESHSSSVHTSSLVSVCQSLYTDSRSLQLRQNPRTGSSSAQGASFPSSSESYLSIAAAHGWQLSDSEVSYWMLQQQSRDELSSADPHRAPAPPPDILRAAEGFSILQPIEDSGHSGASEGSASDIGDD